MTTRDRSNKSLHDQWLAGEEPPKGEFGYQFTGHLSRAEKLALRQKLRLEEIAYLMASRRNKDDADEVSRVREGDVDIVTYRWPDGLTMVEHQPTEEAQKRRINLRLRELAKYPDVSNRIIEPIRDKKYLFGQCDDYEFVKSLIATKMRWEVRDGCKHFEIVNANDLNSARFKKDGDEQENCLHGYPNIPFLFIVFGYAESTATQWVGRVVCEMIRLRHNRELFAWFFSPHSLESMAASYDVPDFRDIADLSGIVLQQYAGKPRTLVPKVERVTYGNEDLIGGETSATPAPKPLKLDITPAMPLTRPIAEPVVQADQEEPEPVRKEKVLKPYKKKDRNEITGANKRIKRGQAHD